MRGDWRFEINACSAPHYLSCVSQITQRAARVNEDQVTEDVAMSGLEDQNGEESEESETEAELEVEAASERVEQQEQDGREPQSEARGQ